MNHFRLCKKVLKYDKKVLTVDMKELNYCLKHNFNALNTICKSNALRCKGINMENLIDKIVTTDNSLLCALVCGVLGTIWGYIYAFTNMDKQESKINKVRFLTVTTLTFGTGGVLIGLASPCLLVCAGIGGIISVPIFIFGYVPIWIHDKLC